MRRASSRFLAAAAVLLLAGTSHADPKEEKLACVAAHTLAQELIRTGDLAGAQSELAVCVRATCPPLVQEDCKRIADELAKVRANIVVDAKFVASEGRALPDLRVTVDGTTVATGAGEHRFEVPVGEHVVRVEAVDGSIPPRESRVRAHAGDNHLSFLLDAPPAPCGRSGRLCASGEVCHAAADCAPSLTCGPAGRCSVVDVTPPPKRETSPDAKPNAAPKSYVLGGIFLGLAGVGLGGFTGFGLDGRSRESDLGACAPRCDSAAIDGMYRSYAIADVSLAVSVVSALVGTYLVLRESNKPATTAAAGPPLVRY